jgi:zinc transport system substrate-binding protein
MKKLFLILLIVAFVFCFFLSAYAENQKITVIASLFPQYDFARAIGRDKVDISLILPPGIEPHSFDPKPGDVLKINRADVFIYTGKYMEPWVEGVLKGIRNKNLIVVDSSKGVALAEGDSAEHFHGDFDPHIWLDFYNAQIMVDNICEAFVKKDPTNKGFYIKNSEEYKAQLQKLDESCKEYFLKCKHKTFIYVGHSAFGYFVKRYNLYCISPYRSFSPDAEPTPRAIAELVDRIKENNMKCIYFEELVSPKTAEMISEETGVEMLLLNGGHNISKKDLQAGETFLSIMEENIKNLQQGIK